MYTQCPQCMTYFQVTPEHLKVAQGNVRCGQCSNVFSALGNLTELPPEAITGNSSPSKHIFEENMSASFEDFEQDLASNSSPQQKTNPETTQSDEPSGKSGLGAAIDAIKKLNTGDQAIKSLLDGRQKIIDKLQKDIPPAPIQKKPAPAPKKSAPAKSNVRPTNKVAPANKVTANKSATNAATTSNAATNSAAPKQAVKKTTPTPPPKATPTKTPQPRATPNLAQNTPRDEIDLDKALLAIDELDISSDIENGAPRFYISDQEFFGEQLDDDDNKEQPIPARQPEPIAEPAHEPPVKIKSLERTSNLNYMPVPANTGLQVIPKPLLEDFKQARASSVHAQAPKQKMSLWTVGSILLMFVFLVQTIIYKHDDLARINTFRPWIEALCEKANCEISLPFEAKKLELLGQDIRSHPKISKALLVSVTIINNASYPHAYPGLQITFTDMNDQKIAMRRFLPHEYVKKLPLIQAGMRPNTPVQVELELLDPGSKAVNFEFSFFRAS